MVDAGNERAVILDLSTSFWQRLRGTSPANPFGKTYEEVSAELASRAEWQRTLPEGTEDQKRARSRTKVINALALMLIIGMFGLIKLMGGNSRHSDDLLPFEAWWRDRYDFPLYIVLVGAGVLVAVLGYMVVRRSARRSSLGAYQVLSQAAAAPVVWLRSFQVDSQKFVEWSFDGSVIPTPTTHRLEEVVAAICLKLGPFVTIGDPDESMPELGAFRTYVPHSDWQGRAQGLMKEAQAIVVALDNTPGLQWEIDTITANDFLHKTVFITPIYIASERAQQWKTLASQLGPKSPLAALLSDPDDRLVAAYQTKDGRAAGILSDPTDAADYQRALTVALYGCVLRDRPSVTASSKPAVAPSALSRLFPQQDQRQRDEQPTFSLKRASLGTWIGLVAAVGAVPVAVSAIDRYARPEIAETEAEDPVEAPAQNVSSFRDCAEVDRLGYPVCPEMVLVPAGRVAKKIANLKYPGRRVANGFAVSRFEISIAQWEAAHIGGRNQSRQNSNYPRGMQPAASMSRDEAKRYTEWLSKKTGKTYRLLRELEWEYIATAGYGDHDRAKAFKPSSAARPVDLMASNALGIAGLDGNVGEWVIDCAGETDPNPDEDRYCMEGVRRGADHHFTSTYPSRMMAALDRSDAWASRGYTNVGFRVMRER